MKKSLILLALLGCVEPSKKVDTIPQVSAKALNTRTYVGNTVVEKIEIDGQQYLVFYDVHSLFVIKQDLTPEKEAK